ncbi:MAG TPA: glycosyl hydrolase [Opitutaceae bacterium]|nr:glycosyl hydrolase [Opitutaceae bacterium]
MRTPRFCCVALLSFAFAAGSLRAADLPGSDLDWPKISRENKPWTRWWWPGSAVDKANLTRELEAIAAAGFGGVEITPIYGAKGYEDRFIDFLSPKWMEMLEHVGREAKRLDLAVDMATGTGWPFGGPWITPEFSNTKIVLKDGRLAGEPTKMMVKRAAPGDAGLVIDPYSPEALRRYLAPIDRAFANFPRELIHTQFHDSFEYYDASWTPDFAQVFQRMHGYGIQPFAAELMGAKPVDADTLARLKTDYRETLSQLHLDYLHTWVEWSHAHGWLVRNQSHGAPANLLDLYANADIPETEIFGSHDFPIPGFRRDPGDFDPTPGRTAHPSIIHRFASSAAHVAGREFASSETFTWLREHFREAPSEMKPEADALFLTGINHIFYHGNCYSPADAPWPGWVFYASTQFNTRNPLWRDFGDSIDVYIARAQSLLQSGAPDNDLLVYWPLDDLWHNPEGMQIQLTVHAPWLGETACGKLMSTLDAQGYTYDLISDAQLEQTNADANGGLKTPGAAYRAIVVPKTEHLPLPTLQRLLALANDGATVLFLDALPADVPGFGHLDERRAQFKSELARLQFSSTADGTREAKLGRGRVVVAPLAPLLATAKVAREPLTDTGLRFVRRRTAEGYVYFVANLTDKPVEGWVRLGRPAHAAVQMNPRRGGAGVATLRQRDGATEVYVQQAPGESYFLKTLTNRDARGARSSYSERGTPVALDGSWKVTPLAGGPELPAGFTAAKLASWTAQGGEWERFGGTARYETEFTLPAGAKADDWLLDLGDVRETARVIVNGVETDLIWSLPFRTKIGPFLKPGKNTLALVVTNTAANRIRDLDRRKVEWKKFYEINFVNIAYKPFDASTWALQPSGLLGPVTLTPLHKLSL